MRVAVFSDIHGNDLALDAVLQAARAEGLDTFWCLGDVAAHGSRPVDVVTRLRGLTNLVCVRGNTDRYVLTGDVRDMVPPIDHPTDPEGHRVLVDARKSFAWTRGCLAGSGHIEWLASLPSEHRLTLPDGVRVLLVHASPGRDDGPGLGLDEPEDALAARGFNRGAADLMLVGHTHVPGERRGRLSRCESRIGQPAPVSNDQARWLLLEATASG